MAGGELSGTSDYLQGRPCPKCGYVRTAAETNPDWQCPKCRIAYRKFGTAMATLTSRFAEAGHAVAAEGVSDNSTRALLVANIFAAAIAVASKMDLRDMLLVYWVQSVVIGVSFFIRMLNVRQYAVLGGSEQNPEYVLAADDARSGKISAAVIFLLVFAVVHAAYLGVLTGFGTKAGAHLGAGLVLCGLIFALNHAYSLARSIRLDRGGIANLSFMMYLPWLRVVPMQAVILLGVQLAGGTAVMLLFIALKTAVDVLVHVMEQQEWRRVGPPVVPSALRGPEPPQHW